MGFNLILKISISVFSMGVSYDLIRSVQNPIDSYQQRLKRIFHVNLAILILFGSVLLFSAYGISELFQGVYLDLADIKIFVERPMFSLIIFIESFMGLKAIFVSIQGIYMRKGPCHSSIIMHIIKRQIAMVAIRFLTQTPGNLIVLTHMRQNIIDKVTNPHMAMNLLQIQSAMGLHFNVSGYFLLCNLSLRPRVSKHLLLDPHL
jgi:hypothetical protein